MKTSGSTLDRAAVLSQADYFPLDLVDERRETLRSIRLRFAAAGYSEPRVAGLLGLREIGEAKGIMGPLWARHLLSKEDPFHNLVRAFFLGLAVPAEALAATFSATETGLMLDLGLLKTQEDGRLRAPVLLNPFAGLLVATDWWMEPDPSVSGAAQRVMYLGWDSCLTARMAAAGRGKQCLDLGTGSGIIALAAAATHGWVVGVDINPRAVNFARFNARLNGIGNCEFILGDLFEPVAGRRFDRLVSNPPFVPSPCLGDLWFRDGGKGGEEVLSRILRGCREHLEEMGTVLVRADLVHHQGRDYHDKVRAWLGGGEGFNAVILETPAMNPFTYAIHHNHHLVAGTEAWETEVSRWIDGYLAEGIERINAGCLLLRRRGRKSYRGLSLAVDNAFGRRASLAGFCEGLLDRFDEVQAMDLDTARLELDCEAGEVELSHPGKWPGVVRLGYDLFRALDESRADGFTAVEIIEAFERAGRALGGNAAQDLRETLALLFVAGYLRHHYSG